MENLINFFYEWFASTEKVRFIEEAELNQVDRVGESYFGSLEEKKIESEWQTANYRKQQLAGKLMDELISLASGNGQKVEDLMLIANGSQSKRERYLFTAMKLVCRMSIPDFEVNLPENLESWLNARIRSKV